LVTVTVCAESAVMVANRSPKCTAVAFCRLVPLIATVVLPPVGPWSGTMPAAKTLTVPEPSFVR
jgi:hypothetical protein